MPFSLSVPTHCTKTTQVCILWKTKALYKQKQNIHIKALTLYLKKKKSDAKSQQKASLDA